MTWTSDISPRGSSLAPRSTCWMTPSEFARMRSGRNDSGTRHRIPNFRRISLRSGISGITRSAGLTCTYSAQKTGSRPQSNSPKPSLTLDSVVPMQVYSREMIRRYLWQVRQRCQTKLTHMTDEEALRLCSFPWIDGPLSYFELQLYSMRHVQEHVAQLHLFLGKRDADGDSDWISTARLTRPDD